MAWPDNTRLHYVSLGAQARPVGGGVSTWRFDRSGILSKVYLLISGTLGGVAGGPNALGQASIIRRVRTILNSGIFPHDLSGAGYHYLLRDHMEHGIDVGSYTTARAAIAAGACNLDMVLPVAINSRDPSGLINLQNEDTSLSLEVQWEADATVDPTITFAGFTCEPIAELLTVPQNPRDWPAFRFVQTITEDQEVAAAAGTYTYPWPRANVYLQMLHGAGIGVVGADLWTQAQLRVAQNYFIDGTRNPARETAIFANYAGRARPLGTVAWDLLQTSGLGNYASARDEIDTGALTSIDTVLTISAATTLFHVKRQLVRILPPSAE